MLKMKVLVAAIVPQCMMLVQRSPLPELLSVNVVYEAVFSLRTACPYMHCTTVNAHRL